MINKIWSIAKQNAKEGLYYRFDLLLYIFNFMIEITVYIFIWLAIYNNGDQILNMSFEEVTTYYILVISLSPIINWGINEMMGESIREGEILRELLNPISYFNYYFGIRIGELIESAIVGILTFIICSLLFGILLPAGMTNFLLFVMVIVLAVVIVYFFELIIGMTAFYTNSIWGVEIFKRAILSIFSGMIAPIGLFPEFLQKIANILPFKDCIYTPISIYFGELNNLEIVQVLFKQCIWIFVFYIIAKVLFNKAIKNITVNGG
ncbi:MAG: ABC transporter permease [Clostridia bacterium]|nr:ABC transporter permease [Clostridia bacterium]